MYEHKAETRTFLLTETTWPNGEKETKCQGDIEDIEVMLYLQKRAKKAKQTKA